jgi:hypothetical protein
VSVLPGWCVVFSVGIRLVSGIRYAWGVTQHRAEPNPATWLLWGATALIALMVQLPSGVSGESFVLLAQGGTPLVVFVLALRQHGIRRYLTPLTITCSSLAVLGVVAWRVTTQPVWAVVCAILVDFLAAVPTLHKAWGNPRSEYPLPYLLSAVSLTITVATLHGWQFTVAAFPLYLVGVNVLLFTFATLPLRAWLVPHAHSSTPQGMQTPPELGTGGVCGEARTGGCAHHSSDGACDATTRSCSQRGALRPSFLTEEFE